MKDLKVSGKELQFHLKPVNSFRSLSRRVRVYLKDGISSYGEWIGGNKNSVRENCSEVSMSPD